MFGLNEDELRARFAPYISRFLSYAQYELARLPRLKHKNADQTDGRQDGDGNREYHTGRLQSPMLSRDPFAHHWQRDRHIRDDEVGGADLGTTIRGRAFGDRGKAAAEADALSDAGDQRRRDRVPTNDESCSATARITMPATRIAQPIATARCGLRLRAAICATADAKKIKPAISPATAWLSIPTTPETNDGATAANSPVTAKPANAAREATTKTARTSGGTDSRCTPMRPLALRGLRHDEHRHAGQQSQHYVHDETQVQGRGRVLDEETGQQRPDAQAAHAVATVAIAAARVRHDSGAASMTAAVAVPVKTPADSPDKTRATSNRDTESATGKPLALASANTTPASSTGRLPIASDHLPNASSANSTPPAYVA